MNKSFSREGFVPIGILVLLLLTVGLVLAVTRVSDLKSVLNLPKAAGRQVVSTWELIYGNKNSSDSASPAVGQQGRVSTWELIFGNRNSSGSATPTSTPTPTPTPTLTPKPTITVPTNTPKTTIDGSYKSPVTSNGNFADLKITNNGTTVVSFTDRFDVPACNLKNYVVEGPTVVQIANGNFSFNQNGFLVSGTLDSVTSRLENYPVSECGNGAKVNAGPFTYTISLQ